MEMTPGPQAYSSSLICWPRPASVYKMVAEFNHNANILGFADKATGYKADLLTEHGMTEAIDFVFVFRPEITSSWH
jgi:hypothetical protein